MVDASSAELLREMNEKRKKARLLPGAIVLSVIVLLLLLADGMPAWLVVLSGALAVGFCWLASMRDELRKTTVILYDLELDVETAYARLHDVFGVLRSCSRTWHIEARGEVRDRKYHAGAGGVVKRKQVTLTSGAQPFVKANIEVPLVRIVQREEHNARLFSTPLMWALDGESDRPVSTQNGQALEVVLVRPDN
jgi:hypothetical protein